MVIAIVKEMKIIKISMSLIRGDSAARCGIPIGFALLLIFGRRNETINSNVKLTNSNIFFLFGGVDHLEGERDQNWYNEKL